MTPATDKWTAFLLSACVPGAGQLAAGSWSCLAWFGAAGLLVAVDVQATKVFEGMLWIVPIRLGAGAVLCLLSAEHARRLLEKGSRKGSAVLASRVSCPGGAGRKVDILISLDLARSAKETWSIIRDLPRFLTIDPFHDAVTLMRRSEER